MKTGLIGIATYAVAIVMAVAIWAPQGGEQTYAQAADPQEAVENLVAGANAAIPTGDGAAFANTFTENGVFANRDDAFAIVGRHAMTVGFSEDTDPAFHATLNSSEVDGNTVTGAIQIADQDSVDAGVGSHIELFTATVEDGLVASLILTYDHDDPDTVTYLEYHAEQQDDDEGPPPDAVEIELAGTQPGHAFIAEFEEGISAIGIEIEPGEEGVVQPAHVHTGTCEEPGGIVYPLAYPLDGSSFTILSASEADLINNDYIVNVHLSEAEPGTYVSCAALEAGDAGPTPTPATTLPDTGTGVSDDSSAVTWLIASLALVGIGGVAGASVVARRRS